MSAPLTPDLYRRLVERFGSVVVANEGEAAIIRNSGRLLGSRVAGGAAKKSRPEMVSPGEYYRVCCPKCGDLRHRLWISHRFAEFPWSVICYNADCYSSVPARDQLMLYLFKTRKPKDVRVNPGRRDGATLRPVEMPGVVIPLHLLPRDHPANQYLEIDRGFDAYDLSAKFGIGYCAQSSDYPQCSNKIIIPILMNGVLVGWQARFIGERNWKASSFPKYYDMPGMPKRLMFYNHDNAKHQPWVALVEGVTDVYKCGLYAMGLLGGTITFSQRKILAFPPFRDKPIVIMLDGEAYIENEAVADELKREHQAGVVRVDLPSGIDPGQLEPDVNLDFIYRSADAQGVPLVKI